MIEVPPFDAVNQFLGLAICRNEIKKTPGIQYVPGILKDALGEFIPLPEIVHQPAVDLLLAQGRLDRSDFGSGGLRRRCLCHIDLLKLRMNVGYRIYAEGDEEAKWVSLGVRWWVLDVRCAMFDVALD